MKPFTQLFALPLTSVLLLSAVARTDEADALARIDKQLAELTSFRYERNGDSLRDLETTIMQLPSNSPLRARIEDRLIGALDGSNDIGKGIICRLLRVAGTDKCIPAVAPMLSDPRLADVARHAVQGIGGRAAAEAMHAALGKASGAARVGLINALAELAYEPVRADCIPMVQSEDPAVAAAAIQALGKLGGTEAIEALKGASGNAPEQLAADIDLALGACADHLLQAGEREGARELFALLYEQAGPSRLAALRGLVLASPDQAAVHLLDAIRGQDGQLALWAINLTPYATGTDATAQFVAMLPLLPAESKIVMLGALGKRGDPGAVAAVVQESKSDSAPVRQAALEALGGLSDDRAIATLIQVAADGEKSDQRIARASLARMNAAEARLAALAGDADEKLAVEAINALAARKASGQSELILRLVRDESPRKRAAALEALGVLIDGNRVDELVSLALEEERASDRKNVERALGRVLLRMKSPEKRARPILAALPAASAQARPPLIRQLAKAGTGAALAAVRAALESTDADSSDAAVVTLANWPNSAAGDDLVKLIETARTDELKKSALDGFIRIASESADPTAMLLGALKQVSGSDRKKQVLAAMGDKCDSFEAIAAARGLFDDPELKATAARAAIHIADKLRSGHEAKARTVLEQIIAAVDDPEARKQAREVLNDIDKYQDHIMRWVAIGPFADKSIDTGEQSYKTAYEPEQADTSKLEWKPLELGIGRWEINLEATYGPMDHCCAYVRTMVWSPIDQDIQIEGGCDDALKMWVNAELVFDDYGVRGGSPRKMRAPAKLRQGWNELKLKAVDHEGGWAFGCRIRKPDGTKLEGLKFEAR